MRKFLFRGFLLACLVGVFSIASAQGQENDGPSARLSDRDSDPSAAFREAQSNSKHPLDPGLRLARHALQNIEKNVFDYTATLVRRERVKGKLIGPEYSFLKVRNPRVDEKGTRIPFSIYMRVAKPEPIEGREVIWVQDHNENKLIAHESPKSLLGGTVVRLDPYGFLATRESRYPITEAGVKNLVIKLIEKGERDKLAGDCQVKFYKNAKINGRSCTLMEVTHPEKEEHFDFHVAQIFIDDEMQLPIRYAAWTWPEEEGGEKVLLEEYTYLNLNVNVGLTDQDFNPENPEYKYKK